MLQNSLGDWEGIDSHRRESNLQFSFSSVVILMIKRVLIEDLCFNFEKKELLEIKIDF